MSQNKQNPQPQKSTTISRSSQLTDLSTASPSSVIILELIMIVFVCTWSVDYVFERNVKKERSGQNARRLLCAHEQRFRHVILRLAGVPAQHSTADQNPIDCPLTKQETKRTVRRGAPLVQHGLRVAVWVELHLVYM